MIPEVQPVMPAIGVTYVCQLAITTVPITEFFMDFVIQMKVNGGNIPYRWTSYPNCGICMYHYGASEARVAGIPLGQNVFTNAIDGLNIIVMLVHSSDVAGTMLDLKNGWINAINWNSTLSSKDPLRVNQYYYKVRSDAIWCTSTKVHTLTDVSAPKITMDLLFGYGWDSPLTTLKDVVIDFSQLETCLTTFLKTINPRIWIPNLSDSNHFLQTIYKGNVESFGLGTIYNKPSALDEYYPSNYSVSTLGYTYFVVASSFPLQHFMINFFQDAGSALLIPSGAPQAWILFRDFCSLSIEYTNSPTTYRWGFYGSYRPQCHYAFCSLPVVHDYGTALSEFYTRWPLRSYFDPSSQGIAIFPSKETGSMSVTLNPDNRTTWVLAGVEKPTDLADDKHWAKYPGQAGNSTVNDQYSWHTTVYYYNLRDFGCTLYSQDPDAPPAPPEVPPAQPTDPTDPDPTPTPPPPLPDDPTGESYTPPVVTGTNGPFWTAVLDPTKTLAAIINQFPLPFEQHISDVVALREYTEKHRDLSNLQVLLSRMMTGGTWNLKELLSSNLIVPNNLALVPNIIQWVSTIAPALTTTVSMASSSSDSMRAFISGILDRSQDIPSLIASYPLDSIQYGAHLMALAKFVRTGTYS